MSQTPALEPTAVDDVLPGGFDPVRLGLNTFGDVPAGTDGVPVTQAQAIRNVVEEGVAADRVGLDFFGVGEHHIDEWPLSAPDLALAAIAARTGDIHLGSAVTVLSTDDPVRVYERYATLDALSNGRAEVVIGRGSSVESFPLFGFRLEDYELLFEEKLDLFARLREELPLTWSGQTRAPLDGQRVVPLLEDGPLPTWVGVGGSPESVVRAARHGLSLMLAIIGGPAARFAPLADLYRRALVEFGRPPAPIGVHSMGHVGATDADAREEYWTHYADALRRMGPSRGFPPPDRQRYAQDVGPAGALYVGSPDTVATKIVATMRVLGATRFDLKYGVGTLPHASLVRGIELYGTEVAPRVRAMLEADPIELPASRPRRSGREARAAAGA